MLGLNLIKKKDVTIPIATKLIIGFLIIVVITSAVFSMVGVQLIGDRIVSQAQEKVHTDLNAAREIYLGKMSHVNDVVRFTADRFFLRDALLSGNISQTRNELRKMQPMRKIPLFIFIA